MRTQRFGAIVGTAAQTMHRLSGRTSGPDILGSVAVEHEGGAWTMVLYFTSEEDAREGEKKEPPPELKAQMDEMNSLSVGMPEFLDVKEPRLYSPR